MSMGERVRELEEALAVTESEKKRSTEWWANYRRRATAELGQPAEVMELANNGDAGARAAISAALDRAPAFVAFAGSFTDRTEEALLNVTSGGDWTLREARKRTLQALRDEIAGPSPTALEAALAHVLAMSLVEADDLATRALRNGATDSLDRRRTRAHARAMSTARTLAVVRRLALPAVRVSITHPPIKKD